MDVEIDYNEDFKEFHGLPPFSSVKNDRRIVISKLDSVINSMMLTIEKGDPLQIGLVFGQSIAELKSIRNEIESI
jgi:hypothetical protein